MAYYLRTIVRVHLPRFSLLLSFDSYFRVSTRDELRLLGLQIEEGNECSDKREEIRDKRGGLTNTPPRALLK